MNSATVLDSASSESLEPPSSSVPLEKSITVPEVDAADRTTSSRRYALATLVLKYRLNVVVPSGTVNVEEA